MSIFDQLNQWKESKVIVELHYIVSNVKKIIHGRIYSFDAEEQKILFYNDDAKNIENVLLAQIEDIYAPESLADSPPKRMEETAKQTNQAAESQASQREATEKLKKNLLLKKEISTIIDSLPITALHALLPLLKHLSKMNDK